MPEQARVQAAAVKHKQTNKPKNESLQLFDMITAL